MIMRHYESFHTKTVFTIAKDRFIQHQIVSKNMYQFIKEIIFSIRVEKSSFFYRSGAAADT